jgi:hypothetical protein
MTSAKPWLHDFDPEHHSTFFETSPTGWTIDKFDKERLLVILARKLENLKFRLKAFKQKLNCFSMRMAA